MFAARNQRTKTGRVSLVSFRPGSFRHGSFHSGWFRPCAVSALIYGSFRPFFQPQVMGYRLVEECRGMSILNSNSLTLLQLQ